MLTACSLNNRRESARTDHVPGNDCDRNVVGFCDRDNILTDFGLYSIIMTEIRLESEWGIRMKKGMESRNRIIDAAEKLFARKGYAATSVQDILDALGISKGGFYHYFDTKMELLTEVCARRTEDWYLRGVEAVRGMQGGCVEKLNAAIKLMNMLNREGPSMLATLTETGLSGEDAPALQKIRATTMRIITPLIAEILENGVDEHEFLVRRPEHTARLITALALDINEELSRDIAVGYASPECAYNAMELLNTYRETIELMVNAPYGSIQIFDLAEMVDSVSRIAERLSAASQRS